MTNPLEHPHHHLLPTLKNCDYIYENHWAKIRIDYLENQAGEKTEYAVLERSDYVEVVVENTCEEILFIEQYRHPINRFILELPGGAINAGEPVEEAVKREVLEETGMIIEAIRCLGVFDEAPAYATQKAHVYHCILSAETENNPDPFERCARIHWMNRRDIITLLAQGKISDLQTIACLTIAGVLGDEKA